MTTALLNVLAKVSIVKRNGIYALAADRPVDAGEALFPLRGTITDLPSRYSVQIAMDRHLEPYCHDPQSDDSFIRFLNHSCDPNSYLDLLGFHLRASRAIRAEEEVTIDYNFSEFEMASPFNCSCNSQNCYGEILGFRHLPFREQIALMPRFAPHLQLYMRERILSESDL